MLFKSDVEAIEINSNKKRHLYLNNIFINNNETNLIIKSEKLYLQNKILKQKTNVIEQNKVVMDATTTSSQINSDTGVYSNLSDLSDNVTVKLNNNVEFKVTRTTDSLSVGEYIIQPVTGTIEIFGRYNGTLTNTNEQLGPYLDDDEIYVNNQHFFFGGFGTDGIDQSTKTSYSTVVVTQRGLVYLNNNGGIQILAKNATYGNNTGTLTTISANTGENIDITSGIIHVTGNEQGFCGLTSSGKAFSWGSDWNNSMVGSKSWCEPVTKFNRDVIKIYSTRYFNMALTKNRELFVWGNIPSVNGVGQILTSNWHDTNKSSKPPVISPFRNIHKVIVNEKYGTVALITFKRELITFGHYTYGGDYQDDQYGVYGTVNSFTGKSTIKTVLTNIKKVICVGEGFVALTYDGKVYIWGRYGIQNRDDDLHTGVLDIKTYFYGFFAYFSTGVKLYYLASTYHSINFTNIQQDVSKNCVFTANGRCLAFLRNDNKLFVCGDDEYGGLLTSAGYYNYSDKSDIVSNHVMKNVSKVYASNRGFAVIKTNGSVVAWGYNDSGHMNYIAKTYGGDVNSNVSKLFTNDTCWCALKDNGTIVTWENDISGNHPGGSNFFSDNYGINSTKLGGAGTGGSVANSYYSNNKLGFIKNVVPIPNGGGFVAIASNNNVERIFLWGTCDLVNTSVTDDELKAFNNSSDKNLNFLNTYYYTTTYHYSHNNDNNFTKKKTNLPYKKLIDVKVQSVGGNNKFVFNNDLSNNPLTDKTLEYEFNLNDSSLATHPFEIITSLFNWFNMGYNGNTWNKTFLI